MDFINGLLKKIFKKEEEVCGMDIGSSAIKVAAMVRGKKGLQLTRYASCSTPPATIKDGAIVDAQTLGETIRELLRENNFPADCPIVSAVSGQSVVIRPIKMPIMTERELSTSIQYQADQYLPYAVSDAQVSGIILRESLPDEPNTMEVLLVAAPKEMITNTRELIQIAGAVPEAVDLEPFALLRAIQESNPEVSSGDKTIALINLGASSGSVNIFKAGLLRHNRTISIAGNSFTKAIGQELNLSFEEAERFKIEKCVVRVGENDSEPVAPTTMRVFKIIVPVLQELVRDIQRSFDYYRSREKAESVDLVVLSGGTARMKNIDVYLANELSIECQIANPFRSASISNVQGISADDLEALAPMAMVVAGLALRKR
ncbi:MAG: type IV pilus assembly protein PilM [Candidatus Bruticola sp.]